MLYDPRLSAPGAERPDAGPADYARALVLRARIIAALDPMSQWVGANIGALLLVPFVPSLN